MLSYFVFISYLPFIIFFLIIVFIVRRPKNVAQRRDKTTTNTRDELLKTHKIAETKPPYLFCPACNSKIDLQKARKCPICKTDYICPKCHRCRNADQHHGI